MHNINKPIEKINIGYNRSNEEYIGLASEKNKIKRQQESSKEHQERLKAKEREAGFNVHFSGANEERIKELRRQEILQQRASSRGNRADSQTKQAQPAYDYDIGVGMQNQKVRRMWKNPGGQGSQQQITSQESNQFLENKYTNPFDLGTSQQERKNLGQPPLPSNQPARARKGWGDNNQDSVMPKSSAQNQKVGRASNHRDYEDDEEQYSDSFENDDYNEEHKKGKPLKMNELSAISGIQDNYNDDDEDETSYAEKFSRIKQQQMQEIQDSPDRAHNLVNDEVEEDTHEDRGKNDIEHFLKTATMDDINTLRQSLNNFAEFSMKQQNNQRKEAITKIEEDDYIEEEFEEQIETEEEDANDSEEERREKELQEKRRQEQLRQQQLKTQQTTRGAKNRPISAVYNLEPQKIQTQRTQQQIPTYSNPSQAQSQAALYDQQTVQNIFFNSGGEGGAQQSQKLANGVQETPKQPNDSMKKPVNSNPFKRPFSQNIPKRMDNNIQQKAQLNNIETAKFNASGVSNQLQALNIKEDTLSNSQAISQSSSKAPPINQIVQKIEMLEDWQKEKLMEILENLTSLTSSQVSVSSQQVKNQDTKGQSQAQVNQTSLNVPKKNNVQTVVQNLDLKFLSPAKEGQNQQQQQAKVSAFQNPNKKVITLRVLKTYGNPHLCGLTEIEVYDTKGAKITLAPAHITPINLGNGPKIPIARLCDGFKLTNEEKHMWIGYLSRHPQHLELQLQLEKDQDIGGLKIWNYNKSAIDCTKGIKEMQILDGTQVLWEGLIESGKGSTTTEYATFIDLGLNPGCSLPREIQPKPLAADPIEEAFDEEESKDYSLKPHRDDELQTVKKDQQRESKEDFTKRYRSEAQLKQQLHYEESANTGPIWLSGNQQSQRNADQFQSSKSINQASNSRQREGSNKMNPSQEQNNSSFKTYDLLDKYNFNSGQQSTNPSAVSSQQSQRNQQTQIKSGGSTASLSNASRTSQREGSQNAIKPNVGPASAVSHSKGVRAHHDILPHNQTGIIGERMSQLPPQNNQKQMTQPISSHLSIQPRFNQDLQDTSDAILRAVNKVNQITTGLQGSQKGEGRPRPVIVDESLDNLDFFKATNRGRLMNFEEKQEDEKQIKQAIEKTSGVARRQWGKASIDNQASIISPNKGNHSKTGSSLMDSQISSATKQSAHKAHVVVKNPFPTGGAGQDQFGVAVGSKSTQRNKSIKEMKQYESNIGSQGDFLDQFLNNNSNSNFQSKQFQQPTTYQQPTDQIHHIQFAANANQKSGGQFMQGSQKNSLSQSRQGQQMVNDQKKIAAPTYEEKLNEFTKPFRIPNLPSGSKLEFNILQTWGDVNYVGLAGIEVFDSDGKIIQIMPDQISACPPDINILPGYGGDPRTVDKLVDGHYLTTDDCHVWLTPFTKGEDHTITMQLGGVNNNKVSIAMIRLWNYNKSRIHSYRGARLIECTLDGKVIFRGEISKAPGNMKDPESCCEIIMFTENESIMQSIDLNDWVNEQVMVANELENTQRILMQERVPGLTEERPMTATKKFSTAEIQELQRKLRQQVPTSLFDERPQTSAIISGEQEESKKKPSSLRNRFDQRHQELSNQVKQLAGSNDSSGVLRGRYIEVNILETWGDLFYVGLTGIEVWDQNGNPIPLNLGMLDASPRDMNSIQGGGGGSDYRTLDKLINKVNNTMDDNNMWLIPFNKGENHLLKIDLGKTQQISAIKFYNYNKSEEDTLRGAKQITIQLDKKFLTPRKGITLMKAPGFIHPLLDMGHLIKFPYKIGWTNEQIIPLQRPLGSLGLFQEYELVNLPMGFQLKINLYSTHGDFYYIGLNGLEFYDQKGNYISPSQQSIKTIIAEPQGVHKLPLMENDVRVVQNLLNGKNQTNDEVNMWLAPFKNTRSYSAVTNASKQSSQKNYDSDQSSGGSLEYRVPNYVCIVFDQPTVISAIRLWNYTKTPSRGINEFEILFDDKQIYRGFAKQAPEPHQVSQKDFSTVVLFTTENSIVNRFQNQVHYNQTKQQEVALINEKKIMNSNKAQGASGFQQRPGPEQEFVFSEMQRPTTMARKK